MRILLDNALRHTPSGTHVTVGAARNNGTAGLIVTDTGPGLPERERAKVFERFYTGDAARGAGLGLAIARELAERMDGRLRVRSAPQGTAFTLELPTTGTAREAQPRRLLLAVAGLVAAGCDSDDDDELERAAQQVTTTRVQVVEGLGREGGFDPAQIYDRLGARRGDDPVGVRGRRQPARGRRRGRAGLRASCSTARATSRRTPTWSRATAASRAEEVFVEFSDGNRVPGQDRGGRPERRRRPAEGRPRGPVAHAAAARRLAHDRRRPAGGGDRQPVRRAPVALDRRDLSHRPQHRVADPLPDRRRDPDRRGYQPGQLRRPAARRPRPRARHQRPDQVAVRRRRGSRLRDPGRRRAPLAARAARQRPGRSTATWACRRWCSGRSWPSGSTWTCATAR